MVYVQCTNNYTEEPCGQYVNLVVYIHCPFFTPFNQVDTVTQVLGVS